MRKPSNEGFAAASVLTASLASICCTGPVVVAVLGFGAFGASAAFEEARPYLLGATAVLLATAFYLSYRRSPAADCAGGICDPSVRKRQRKFLWFFAAVAIPLAAFPYYGGFVTGARERSEVVGEGKTAVVRFDVEGMTCENCASGMEATLGREQGVVSAEVDYENRTAQIQYVPGVVSPEQLVARIGELGFRATQWDEE